MLSPVSSDIDKQIERLEYIWDIDLACYRPECQEAAVTRMTIKCGCHLLLCHTHTINARDYLSRYCYWRCEDCDTSLGLGNGLNFVRFETL